MSFKWHGTDPVKKLEGLKGSKQRSILRKAVAKGARQIRKDLKGNVPVRSGALKKSLIIKTKTTKKNTVYSVVGAGKSYQIEYDGKTVKPANYQHLVDAGHDNVEGLHFMEQTWEANQETYLQTVWQSIEEDFRKVLKS